MIGWSADFSRVFDYVTEFEAAEAALLSSARALDGSLTTIVPFGAGFGRPNFIGTSADGSKVLFESGAELLPEANADKSNVYLWDSGTGQLHLASALNDGKAPAKGAFAGAYDWVAKKTPATFADHADYLQPGQPRGQRRRLALLHRSRKRAASICAATRPSEQSQLDGEGKCTEADKACTVLVSASQQKHPRPGRNPARRLHGRHPRRLEGLLHLLGEADRRRQHRPRSSRRP